MKFDEHDKHGSKLLAGILHVNSYNIWYNKIIHHADNTITVFILLL